MHDPAPAPDEEKSLEDDSLAGRIRRSARESGQSVYRLAQLADVDQSTLNKFLTGSRDNLRLDMADRLCRTLGLELVSAKNHRPLRRKDARG